MSNVLLRACQWDQCRRFEIGLKHQDKFAYLGAFSIPPLGAFRVDQSYGGAFKAPDFNQRMRLIWLGYGSAEPRFVQAAQQIHQELSNAKVNHLMYESVGTSHEWQTWRRCLHDSHRGCSNPVNRLNHKLLAFVHCLERNFMSKQMQETGEATATLTAPGLEEKPITVVGTQKIRQSFDDTCLRQAINTAQAPASIRSC